MSKNRLQNILTKEILEYEYKILGNFHKMAEKLNVSIDSISKYMKLYDIQYTNGMSKIYSCNENLFSTETENSFYLAGFIAADGSIQYRKYSKILKITLSNKDENFLYKIKEILNSNHPIRQYRTKQSKLVKSENICVELQIASKNISQNLARFNIVPNKTFIYYMPEWLIKHPLCHHFLRGYFDGDGCISHCGLGKNRTIIQKSFNILGTGKFIEQYMNILIDNAKLNAVKINQKGNVYCLQYSGNKNIQKIYDFLYKNATIFLERKHNKFISQPVDTEYCPKGALTKTK